jgi:hypothetical protein
MQRVHIMNEKIIFQEEAFKQGDLGLDRGIYAPLRTFVNLV